MHFQKSCTTYDYCMSYNQTDEGKKVKNAKSKKVELVTLMNISYFDKPTIKGMP